MEHIMDPFITMAKMQTHSSFTNHFSYFKRTNPLRYQLTGAFLSTQISSTQQDHVTLLVSNLSPTLILICFHPVLSCPYTLFSSMNSLFYFLSDIAAIRLLTIYFHCQIF